MQLQSQNTVGTFGLKTTQRFYWINWLRVQLFLLPFEVALKRRKQRVAEHKTHSLLHQFLKRSSERRTGNL